jgi:hypothetical protein
MWDERSVFGRDRKKRSARKRGPARFGNRYIKKEETSLANQQRISVNVQINDQFVRYHATGVYGGISPGGELEMYFTEDIVPPPTSIEVQANPKDNSTSEQIKPGRPTRLVHASVTIPLHSVPSIIAWLESKVKDAEKIGLLVRRDDDMIATSQAAATKEEPAQ